MSRISRKSELSPSVTGSNIDLGKKTQPSVTSGGLGVTREITNIGGVSVTGGVSVDISPIDLGINYDSSENAISVAGGAGLPGGLLGASGGVTIDLDTGEVTGGSVGVEGLGLGVNISASEDNGIGVEVKIQIPFTPIEVSVGFGFPSKSKKKSEPVSQQPGIGYNTPAQMPQLDEDCVYHFLILIRSYKQEWFNFIDFSEFVYGRWEKVEVKYGEGSTSIEKVIYDSNLRQHKLIVKVPSNMTNTGSGYIYYVDRPRYMREEKYEVRGNICTPSLFSYYWRTFYQPRWPAGGFSIVVKPLYCYSKPLHSDDLIDNVPPSFPPFPNPPPRKINKMDECCRESIKLQRLIVRHLGAVSGSNQETLPTGVREIGSTQDGIRQAYPFSVKKRWVDPNAKEDEGIPIQNDRHLALVLGGMIERLERVLGTAEFYKDSDKKLRQSESNLLSWLTGKNNDFRYPDPNDFWLNTDDGIINEKTLEIRSIADGLRYQIEALNRLERILPIAELKDSSIPARWIYPNGKGQLRVGNLIHLCEYMIRKSDKDMGYWPQKITLKAKNPAIEDDEAITTDVHSQADMLRVILQQILDVEGDGDMGSNYDLRRTYLDVMAFQMLAKNNKYLQAITEYLSFDMTEEVSKIPIPFDPFAGQDRSIIEDWWIKFGFGEEKLNLPTKNTESEIERLSEGLLQNSELEVSTVKFGSLDERKEPKTLKEVLLEISKNSSASAAAVTEVASEGALERVVEAAGLAQKLTSFLLRRDVRESLGIGDLDKWIGSAEKGYTDDAESESLRFPESDPFEPYGRPTTQNPAIREIDTKEDKAD